ncbi:MAG: bifunctional folylpolyglutamate synthase/dihydrofolate synthase, partial [Myxococcota bacterium]
MGHTVEPIHSAAEAGAYLESLINFEREPGFRYERMGLAPVRALLAELGDPHRALSVVHIAGSKGKGSTALLLEHLLGAWGEQVGTFTSPHLESWTERFRIAGREVAGERLAAAVERVRPAVERLRRGEAALRPTFFDATTAVALLLFEEAGVDRVVLEVGLGGRLDSTNVVDPAVACITTIELEHTDKLGDTLAAIAGEKAGILKPGVPCVLAAQPPAAAAAIAARAAAVGAPLIGQGREWRVRSVENGMRVVAPAGVRRLPPPRLAGAHQRSNAAQAVAMADSLPGFTLSDDALARGLQSVDWPARLQRLTRGPLVDRLPPGWELWLDGGHNPAAGAMLAQVLGGLPPRPTHLVCGMLNTKDISGYLTPLAAHARSLTAVSIPGEANTLPAEETARQA